MTKLTLHLEKLQVESFPTEEDGGTVRGTVQAHDFTQGRTCDCGQTRDELCSFVYICIEEPSLGCPPTEYTCTGVAPCG